MRVAITGSSGHIGGELVRALRADDHQPVRVVRGATEPAEQTIGWDPANGTIDGAGFEGLDAVVHLAGAGIADERWSPERKQTIRESRTAGTALLARALADLDRPPGVLLSGSAIGFYGDRGDEVLQEGSGPGGGFLADLCVDWEAAATPAVEAGMRVAFLRTGIVQDPDEGALSKMLLPFRLGVGGRLGSGQQWMSWISIDDQVRAILHLLENTVSGPVNLTAPEPVRNITYTKALGRALRRPTILPIPSFGPRALLGKELAETLLHDSQRVVPSVLTASGFEFRHPTIDDCFGDLLGNRETA